MKMFDKIDHILNGLFKAIMGFVTGAFKKIIPAKIQTQIEQSKKQLLSSTEKSKESLLRIKNNSKSKIQTISTRGIQKINVAKEKAQTIGKTAKQFDIKKVDKKKLFFGIFTLFTPLFKKIKAWYLSLKPITIAGFIVMSSAGGLAGINIYKAGKQIHRKTSDLREPASDDANNRRPSYYKVDEKQFKVINVVMPIYLGNKKNLTQVSVDFTFISSNRYIKEYFFENMFLISDRLNSTIEPFIPGMTLTEEGKKIIEDKIKKEINQLIEERGIKGKIDEVHVHSLLAV